MGKLLRSLDHTSPLPPLPLSECALTKEKGCCRQSGVLLQMGGPVLRAELCGCVRTCKACYGLTQRTVGKQSQFCRIPSPTRVVHILNDSQIPSRYTTADFSLFHNRSGNCLEVAERVRTWGLQFTTGTSGLVLSGPVGVGKTFLLVCLAKALAYKGVGVRFVDFFQLLSEIRSTYSKNISELDVLTPLLQVEVLFIDELGKGRNTDFELTVLDQLIMGRYNQNKTTVASTNCTFKEMSTPRHYNKDLEKSDPNLGLFTSDLQGSLEYRVGKRIFSRLQETSQFIEMVGSDYRKRGGETR